MEKPTHLGWKLLLFLACGLWLCFWVVMGWPCPILRLTGIPCPGCGMGRAWLSVFRLDLAGAFGYHPVFWAVPVVGLLVLYDFRLFRRSRLNKIVLMAVLAAVAVNWLLRLMNGPI